MMAFVYRLVFRSGKCYIGCTKGTIVNRLASHCKAARETRNKNHDTLLSRAIRKWGEPVRVEMLAEMPAEQMFAEEIRLIALHDTVSPTGYNSTHGGEGGIHCAEVRKKLSESRKGIKFTDEHRAKLAAAKRGHVMSDALRAKISAAHKGKPKSAEHRRKCGVAISAAFARKKAARLSIDFD